MFCVIILQALLHEAEDLPLMGQRSFAISPGLYSLVAIEKTEVSLPTFHVSHANVLTFSYQKRYV